MKIGILTDTYSSITQAEAEKLGIHLLHMPFYINEETFYEGLDITTEEFVKKLESGATVTTSQPSPLNVTEFWDKALEEYDELVYIPLSSGLSGSCETAIMLSQDERYEGKVFVVNNGRVSTPLHCTILDALELVKERYSAKQIQEMLENARDDMTIYIAVETLEYLKRGGRITPAAAALGNVLNLKPVLKLATGKLDSFKKCRGFNKAKKAMIEAMKNDLETRFKDAYESGNLYLMAATSASPEVTAAWVEEIREAFPGMEVLCDQLPLGVFCHTGTGALGIGCSVKPKRI